MSYCTTCCCAFPNDEYLPEHTCVGGESYDPTAGLPADVRVRMEFDRLNAQVEKLSKFKAYVHERLDRALVPTDPDSEHKSKGCRIGGRLDWLIERWVAAEADFAASRIRAGEPGQSSAPIMRFLGALEKERAAGRDLRKVMTDARDYIRSEAGAFHAYSEGGLVDRIDRAIAAIAANNAAQAEGA